MSQITTLRDMTERFSDLDGLSDVDERERRYQKVRVLHQKGVIVAEGPVAKGKAAAFGLETVCATRLLLALYEIGLDATTLRKALAFMKGPDLEGGSHSGARAATQIGAAVAGIRRGESWTFVLQARRVWHTGELAYTGGFSRDEDRCHTAAEVLNSYGPIHVALTVPASALLRPLLTPKDVR